MLTPTLINNLKSDPTLVSLLGASGPSDAPIRSSFIPATNPDKMIIVGVVLGETFHLGYESGVVSVDVYVKDSISSPIETQMGIVNRICQIIDLKGSQLQDSHTSIVYRLRKVDFSQVYENVSHYCVGSLDFEYYIERG